MPKYIKWVHNRPWFQLGTHEDWRFSFETEEGRTARYKIARTVAEGLDKVSATDMPGRLKLERIKNLKPMFQSVDGFWFVSDRIRKVIEELDGMRQQFVPAQVTSLSGVPVESGPWFAANIHARQSSIVDHLTTADPSNPDHPDSTMVMNPFDTHVTLDAARLNPDINIWREERYGRELFVSNALYAALVKNAVKLPAVDCALLQR